MEMTIMAKVLKAECGEMELYIKDVLWTVKVLDKWKFRDNNKKSDHGATHVNTKEIHIQDKHFSKELLLHELIHAYKSSCMLDQTELDGDGAEEFFAELFCYHGQDILDKAQELVAFFVIEEAEQSTEEEEEEHSA
jgi:hypothetical protein